jgi:hypothetical protein
VSFGLWTLAHAIPDVAWYLYIAMKLNVYQRKGFGTLSAPRELQQQFWQMGGIANQIAVVVRVVLGRSAF